MEKYRIKKGIHQMNLDRVKMLLKQTYWANNRSEEKIIISMQHSICYGVFDAKTDQQVGFARVFNM